MIGTEVKVIKQKKDIDDTTLKIHHGVKLWYKMNNKRQTNNRDY